MGAIGGLLGTAGGVNGTGISGPQSTPIAKGITEDQVQGANTASQNSLASQQALLAALQSQNGLSQQVGAQGTNQALAAQLKNGAANQANVFGQGQNIAGQLAANNGIANQGQVYGQAQGLNAQLAANNGAANQAGAMAQQQGLNQQLGAANGVGTQGAAIAGLQNLAAQQQGTAAQYQNIANGTGPNPAQAALNQSTGQNVASQAALMAGQRGAGANVGLLARQAAQQGAATQQQAVGQAATLQANQQIAGLQGLQAAQQNIGQTQQAIGGLGTTQAGMQQTGIAQQAAQAGQMVSQQQAQQQALAAQAQNQVANQMTNQQALAGQAAAQVGQQLQANQAVTNQANVLGGQQIAQTNAGVAANQNQQQMGLGALNNVNTNNVNMQGNINSANAGLAGTTMKGQQDMIGGLLQGAGSAAGLAAARGGYVAMADGGMPMQPGPVAPPPPGPQSSFGQFLAGGNTGAYLAAQPIPQSVTPDTTQASNAQMQNNSQDSDLKKGSSGLGKAAMMAAMAAKGGSVQHDYRAGGGVKATSPAEKAVIPGNSYANDKIKAVLPEGGIVIPRSIIESDDPLGATADFVSKVIARRSNKSESGTPVKALVSEKEVIVPKRIAASKNPEKSSADFVAKVLAKRKAKAS